MGKNRLALHIAAILAMAFFAFLGISSAASSPKADTSSVDSSHTTSTGAVHDIVRDSKTFETLGLIFVTSVKEFDENGRETSSQEGVVTMLLREAQKIGGNDILNLRIDENVTYTQTQVKRGSSMKTITTKTITYTGSALAIKYR